MKTAEEVLFSSIGSLFLQSGHFSVLIFAALHCCSFNRLTDDVQGLNINALPMTDENLLNNHGHC